MRINVNEKDIEKFDKSEVGKHKNYYFKRIMIIGIILIMFGLVWILFNLLIEQDNIFEYATATISVLFGVYFIFKSKNLKKKEVNKYIHNKKTSK